ncbi:MAG: hypothetical protein A3K19_30750 [Lentisphaerae bacterium RIFOXYB12_FULL_65_16]|nr:MAG: hypothetical protein A3K18_04145 [Lentisphaerae bacterium RIFOXYA12_64_32]OGV88798.1 MAG: hypothetical protein A3K19_30750 [Lentisphaerae bacterium RIFOXYB12_FULL_65_16]
MVMKQFLSAAGIVLGGIAMSVAVAGCSAPRPAPETVAPQPCALPREGLVYYVAPAGNDAWSGLVAEPNAARTDGPFATVEKGRDAIRQSKAANAGLKQPVTVLLRGGVYRLAAPLVFTAADSGTKDVPITYEAYPGEQPVLSGGRRINGWQRDSSTQSKAKCNGKLWSVALPECKADGGWNFNQLFVNGQRCIQARTPNQGAFLRAACPTSKNNSRGFIYNDGDIKPWDNLRDALVVVYHSWETSLHHIASIDEDVCRVKFKEPAPWGMGQWEKQQRYYVENVFEALDEPGEWYLNRTTGTVYYYPRPGEDMKSAEIIAPVVTTTLVDFQGASDKGELVENLHFRGIAFQHTNAKISRIRNPGQGEIYQDAMLQATGLRNSSFENCEIAHAGGHAIWLAGGCEGNTVRQCHMLDLCGGGVYIGGGWGRNDSSPAGHNTVDNNFIHEAGLLFHGAHGVWIGKSSYNTVTHNEISNLDYSAISCGWSWGFQPSSANNNILDYNYIHHLSNGEGLSDMGGIYTLGVSPGTTERFNRLHDIYNYAGVSHGSGIYPDEGSSDIQIENNVVYRVRTCPLFQHYGKDNLVRNNVFAFGGEGQIQRCREDIPCHYIAEGNILYADIDQMLGGTWKSGEDKFKVGRNVYWSTAGAPKFKDMDFEAWKVYAKDEGSIVADPLFVDAANGDFRLKRESPALKLGFKSIDLSQTGLYGDKAWVELPRRYPNRALNEVPKPVVEPEIINYDFELDETGQEPLEGNIVLGKKNDSITVTKETAAAGSQCLKFTDAPDLPHEWMPHIYFNPKYDTGRALVSWDMMNSKDAPASFYVEVREYGSADPFIVGPTVSVTSEGKVTASKQDIGTIPLGEWVHVDIAFELGGAAPGTYKLTLKVPGRDPVVTDVPHQNPAFRKVTWFGISSTSQTKTVFYLDNLKCGSPADLAKPPSRKVNAAAMARKAAAKAAKPTNPQKLVGHWTFDAGPDDVARDSSGTGNDADMSACWAKGAFGTAMCCREDAYSAEVPDDPSLHFGTDSFTIELWLCPARLDIDSKDARRRFMSKSAFPNTWWNLNVTADGKPFIEMTDSNKAGFGGRPSGSIPANAWSHFAVVVDRTAGKVHYFINGKEDSVLDLPATFTGNLDVDGGELGLGGDWQPFLGLLDDVKIYRRALAADEVRTSYEQQRPNRTSVEHTVVE